MRTWGGAGVAVVVWVVAVVGWRGGGVARVEGSRVWVDEAGGYRDVLAVLHPALRPHNCTAFFHNLKVSGSERCCSLTFKHLRRPVN